MSDPIETIISDLLKELVSDPERDGLAETPKRVAKAFRYWLGGYQIDPVLLLKTFLDGADDCGDEIIIVSDIRFTSMCEHHMAPIFGVAHVGYLPKGQIVGLSKLARVVDAFARRLQVQERISNQVADALYHGMDCRGVGCVIHARHMCMESRGVCQRGTITTTSALRGVFRTDPAVRAEFLSLVPKPQDTRL